jgi:signal transduction histidine kinase
MGLGLSLCFRMIQGMAGEVSVDSAEGSHTQFTISLARPVAQA